MSDHYADQAEMFINGQYKVQEMNKTEIRKKSRLLLMPR